MTHLTFVEFLEALARVSVMRALPSAALLARLEITTYADFLQRVEADPDVIPSSELLNESGRAWLSETTECIAERLALVVRYIVHRFDSDSDGRVTRKELIESSRRAKEAERAGREGAKRIPALGAVPPRRPP